MIHGCTKIALEPKLEADMVKFEHGDSPKPVGPRRGTIPRKRPSGR
jgi:hypothetical protein